MTDPSASAAAKPISFREQLEATAAHYPYIEAHIAAVSKPTAPGYEPESFNHKFATVNGYKYHYVEEGNPNGIPVVLIHGVPDLWYGWRNQIRHLAKEGYRVIAIDNLGVGQTDYPVCSINNVDAYRAKKLSANVVALLDELKINKAVIIGHDWGAGIAWRIGMYSPERVITVISIGIPHQQPRSIYRTPDEIAAMFPQLSYMAVFQTNEPETWFGGDKNAQAKSFFTAIFASGVGTNVEQKQYYIDQFTKTGLHGCFNLYRADRLNFEDELPFVDKPYTVPALVIHIDKDPLITQEYFDIWGTDTIQTLERVHISEGGHNVHMENPEAVNQVLTEYLNKFSNSSKHQEPSQEQELKAQAVEH
ncbi:hypothetical protein EDD11_008158 [Mortierella claussenii]|nr:hypothetical protein EDD11_008158 [Mortierella claussenii]